jgi:hypothetical protein
VKLRTVYFILLSIVFVSACKKQDDNVFLANETTKGFEGYSFIDSLQVTTCTVREDSLKSDSLSHNLIGVINDATFGKYQASTYCQFQLSQLNNVLSSNTLDSAVLFLQFTSTTAYYGDLNSEITFNVYEVNESMNYNVTHSNQSYNYDPTPVGTFTGRFAISDSLTHRDLKSNVKGAPGMSIKLSAALAQKLFNASSTNLSSQANFLSYFKGLAIVPTSTPSFGSGAIAAINLKGNMTKLRIYYNDTQQTDLKVYTDSRKFSEFKVSNQSTDITKQKAFGGNANFDTTYVMSMAGAKTKIKLPNLFSIIKNNKHISVGKAEIIIHPLSGTYNAPFGLPKRMLLFAEDKDTKLNAGIIDFVEPNFGGDYNASKNEYRFNITRYIQSLFTDYQIKGENNNRGLFLAIPSDNPVAPSRIVVDSRKLISGSGIEIKLIFTEL